MKNICVLGLAVIWFAASAVSAQEAEKEEYGYIGVSKCSICHKTAKQGEQLKVWEASKHSEAFEVLASEQAKKIAAEKGIENAQEAGDCLKCHVTGYGVAEALLGSKYDMTNGVGCESCHGPGEVYSKLKTMKAIMTGEVDAASVGLVKPDEKVCVTCHNEESPTFKGFDFAKMSKQIAHPIPEEKKASYK